MNKWEEAKKRCETIIATNPNYAEAYNNLAILYDQKNDYPNALKNYATAVNLQPNYVAAHQNLGLLFLKYRKIDEAITQFNNVITLNPLTFSAHYYLGNCYLTKNELELAKTAYLEALSLNGEHSDTLNNLGVVSLKKEEPQVAIDYFTKALAFDINHEDARNNLAATFMQYDRYENAARHYRELLRANPSNMEYHYNIGVAYMNLGHLEEAIEHFNTVLKATPTHVASINNLAAIYWRLNKKTEATALLLKALEIEPDNQNSRYLLSASKHKNEYKQAPPEYIRNLFDNYAVQYDDHLRNTLNYTLPEKVDELLKKDLSRFRHPSIALDLGCGTGLLGQYLKTYYGSLWGVDLSQKMLDQAKKVDFYDQLFCDEIEHFLDNTSQKFDAITALEVFEYFGDLNIIFKKISQHLKPNSLFIFSIEPSNEQNFVLQETARFAHNPQYIHQLAETNHFKILEAEPLAARLQENKPLNAYLFILLYLGL